MTHIPAGGGHALPAARQIFAVGAVALAAGFVVAFFTVYRASPGASQPAAQAPAVPTFVPTGQQLASLRIQRVADRVFHTNIVTDGYVAPNVGYSQPGLAGVARVRAGMPLLLGQSSDLIQAESDFVTAKAQYRVAQTSAARQRNLYRADGTALKDWQQARAELVTASSALASARNRLRLLGKSDAEITALEQHGLPAGAVFSVGAQSTVWLVANVREEDSPLVRLGDPVEVRVPAWPRLPLKARISYVAPVIDAATHRLVVGAAVANTQGRLKPNMLANVTIIAGPATMAPAVPEQAVIHEGDQTHVWVLRNDGSLVLRRIVTGRTDGDAVEVIKGLSPGERIVTGGALFIDRASGNG